MEAEDKPQSQASSAALALKILQVLRVLQGSPAGAAVYRHVQQMLDDLEQSHLRAERTYASLVHALLDAYLQHLHEGTPLHTQIRLLQQQLQPPLVAGDDEALRSQIDLYADHIIQLQQLETEHLARRLNPFLFPDRDPALAPAEPNAGPEGERRSGGGDVQPSPWELGGAGAHGRDKLREVRESLSRQLLETLSQNQEFGVILDLVLGELRHTEDMTDVEAVRHHLTEQIRKLHDAHSTLGERLERARRYLDVIHTDAQHLDDELTRVRALSLTDDLTELPNRRAFMDRLQDEVSRVERYGMPLSLAMIDLDGFKEINDQHGHSIGDEVLRHYASGVFTVFRHHDMVARYGGEEFAVLLPNTGQQGAVCALQKIQRRVAEFSCESDELSLRLPSFSAGLAIHRPGEHPKALIERADQALYRAKRLGRNRVEIDVLGEPGGESSAYDAGDGDPSSRPTLQ